MAGGLSLELAAVTHAGGKGSRRRTWEVMHGNREAGRTGQMQDKTPRRVLRGASELPGAQGQWALQFRYPGRGSQETELGRELPSMTWSGGDRASTLSTPHGVPLSSFPPRHLLRVRFDIRGPRSPRGLLWRAGPRRITSYKNRSLQSRTFRQLLFTTILESLLQRRKCCCLQYNSHLQRRRREDVPIEAAL